MHLLRDGQYLDAEFALDFFEGEPCIVVESSGGATKAGVNRRNPDYNRLVTLLLARLGDLQVRITRLVLDSAKVAAVPSAERTVKLDEQYPLDVAKLDVEELRKSIGRKLAGMYRDPGAHSGGNAQKRFRICLQRIVSAHELQTSAAGLNAPDETELPSLSNTERVMLRNARIGQGKFRQDLISLFKGRCPLTGIETPELLVASHIKPWADSTNQERLDPDNGLLLSALADRAFDRGMMSFSDTGVPIFSTLLPSGDRACLLSHIVGKLALSQGNRKYLDYHRKSTFRP